MTPKEKAITQLTKILIETHSLKPDTLDPELLDEVGGLIEAGASITDTHQLLFYNMPISFIRLSGRVLARLKENKEFNLIWSLIPRGDFIKTNSSDSFLAEIAELISKYSETKLILLLWENVDGKISGLLKVAAPHDALKFLKEFHPSGSSTLAHFKLNQKNLLQAEQIILNNLK